MQELFVVCCLLLVVCIIYKQVTITNQQLMTKVTGMQKLLIICILHQQPTTKN